MNVGLAWFSSGGVGLDSLAHVREATRTVLSARHTLRPCPAEAAAASTAQQRDRLKQWMAACDAILGPVDVFFQPWLRRLRKELMESGERPVPYVAFLLGCMPRGGLEHGDKTFQTSDVLVASCESDAVLAEKFWPNANVCCVPFPYDETTFFRDDDAGRLVRERLGVGADEKIVLYAGRITIEKNVHTLLKVFRVVREAAPNARLVIAGREDSIPFIEFGVVPLDIRRWLRRLADRLGLSDEQVMFIGHRSRSELRALFSAADVFVNLTLHHDENFGLAQVEAMACGLPVVGTSWGGLKDTVVPGETGLQAPAVVTATGVKVDWWQAANHIMRLLATDIDAADRDLRERCRAAAQARYSVARYGELLDRAIERVAAAPPHTAEPIRRSAFAGDFWATCPVSREGKQLGTIGRRSYRQSPEALRLYRELITPFGSASGNGATPRDSTSACAWCLAAPLVMRDDAVTITVNDPMYPFVVSVPALLMERVRGLVDRFSRQPVIPARAFETDSEPEALAWMEDTGLLIRTCAGTLDMTRAACVTGAPGFEMRHVDAEADILWMS